MGSDFLTGSGLQSGFVLGVIVAAFLLASHLGGSAGLAKRAAQVALGLVLMMLVFSATTAFNGPDSVSLEELESTVDFDPQIIERLRDSAEHNSEVGTMHIGLGILFVALGVVVLRKLRTISPALLLGGTLLILLGSSESGGSLGLLESLGPLLNTFLPAVTGDPGNSYKIARFVVLLIGAVLLAGLIYFRWEREPLSDDTEATGP